MNERGVSRVIDLTILISSTAGDEDKAICYIALPEALAKLLE